MPCANKLLRLIESYRIEREDDLLTELTQDYEFWMVEWQEGLGCMSVMLQAADINYLDASNAFARIATSATYHWMMRPLLEDGTPKSLPSSKWLAGVPYLALRCPVTATMLEIEVMRLRNIAEYFARTYTPTANRIHKVANAVRQFADGKVLRIDGKSTEDEVNLHQWIHKPEGSPTPSPADRFIHDLRPYRHFHPTDEGYVTGRRRDDWHVEEEIVRLRKLATKHPALMLTVRETVRVLKENLSVDEAATDHLCRFVTKSGRDKPAAEAVKRWPIVRGALDAASWNCYDTDNYPSQMFQVYLEEEAEARRKPKKKAG